MLEEIGEQPDVLEKTINAEAETATRIGDFIRAKDVDLIVLVARGSSDNAALFGRYLLEITTGIPVSLSAPSVFTLYNAKLRLKRALVIGVSQSGEGDDINFVLERAKEAGAFTVAITNEADSTMAKIADETMRDSRRPRTIGRRYQNVHRSNDAFVYACECHRRCTDRLSKNSRVRG